MSAESSIISWKTSRTIRAPGGLRFLSMSCLWKVSFLLMLVFQFAGIGRSQVLPTAQLGGNVVDPSGAVVPQAAVTLTNAGTDLTKKTQSDTRGQFLFTLVPPGQYVLDVSAPGFSPYERKGITLNVNATPSIRVVLTLGQISQKVTVQANAQMIETQSGSLSQLVNDRYIQRLPLNGRNAAQLVFMAPGAVSGSGQTSATYANNSQAIPISVNGTYGDQVSYKLDGASHQDNISNLNATFPDPDALQEFSVQTNNYDARYGGSAGAIVNIATKSGTNQFHGSAFDFLRNGVLNARNFFAPAQDKLKRNQFGGTLGGPIKRNKIFFFGSYQGTRTRDVSLSNTAFVPSAAMRSGDFSSLSKPIIDPETGQPFQGNVIPSGRILPIATNILANVPSSSDPTGKLLYARPIDQNSNQAFGKVDFDTSRNMLAGSFFYVRYSDPGWNANGTLFNYRLGQLQTTKEFNVHDNYTLSSNMINSVVFDGLILDSHQTKTAPFSIFDFGHLNVAEPAPQFRETQISVSGFSGWGGGGPAPPGAWLRSTFEVSDMLSYIRGPHSLYMGAEFTPHEKFDSRTGYEEEPLFQFTGQATGNALADLLLGYTSTFKQTAGKAKFTRGKQFAAYVQDNWRVNPRLTLNMGLRWEPFLPYSDPVAQQVGGYLAGVQSQRFANAPPGLVFAGDPGFPSGGFHNNLGNLAPRLGVAWLLKGGAHATTLRAGWGMFYLQPMIRDYNNFVENAPFSPAANLFGVNITDPYGSAGVTNPFPPFAPVNPGTDVSFSLPVKFTYFDPNYHLGHENAWNLSIEHQLTQNLLMRVAYVGDRGVGLPYDQETNAAVYGPGATLSNTNQRRPLYPNFASMQQLVNQGTSNYNALQVTAEKRLSQQVSFVANYTYSRSLDIQSFDNQFQLASPNPYDRMYNYGPSDFNAPNNFSFWGIWELPALAAGKSFVRDSLGGWSARGIWTWRSGTPFTITSGQDRSLSGVGLDRADLLGNPFLSLGRPRNQVISEYFNTSAFALNAPGTFGTSPRNFLQNPRFFNVDFALSKSFRVNERLRADLRAEFFNFFNNVHLGQPGTNVSSHSTFGRITSAGDPRIVQVALKLEF